MSYIRKVRNMPDGWYRLVFIKDKIKYYFDFNPDFYEKNSGSIMGHHNIPDWIKVKVVKMADEFVKKIRRGPYFKDAIANEKSAFNAGAIEEIRI